MRKVLMIAAVASLAFTSNANAWGYGRGWNYGPGGGCWTCGSYWGGSGGAVLATVAGAAIVSGIVGALTRPPPPPPPVPVMPVYRAGPNTVPGCYNQQLVGPGGRIAVQTICP